LNVTEFVLGTACFVLGLIIVFFVPKEMQSANQLDYGGYMMRLAMPVALVPLGLGLMIYSII